MVALGEAPSPDELLVTNGAAEIGSRFTLAAPPARDLGHSGVVEALGLRPDPSVEQANDNVVRCLVEVLGVVTSPEAGLGVEAQKLGGTSGVEVVHRVLVNAEDGFGSAQRFHLVGIE